MPSFKSRISKLLVGLFVLTALGAMPIPVAQAVSACTSSQFTITAKHNSRFYFDTGDGITGGYTAYLITNKGASAQYWAKIESFSGGSISLGTYENSVRDLGLLSTNGTSTQFWYLKASSKTDAEQNYYIRFYTSDPTSGGVTATCEIQSGFSRGVDSTISASANKLTSVTYDTSAPVVGETFKAIVKGQTGTIGAGDDRAKYNDVNLYPATNPAFDSTRFQLVGTSYKCDAAGSPAAVVNNLWITNACEGNYTAEFTYKYVSATETNASAKAAISPIMQIASGTQIKHTTLPSFTIAAVGEPSTVTNNATSVTSDGARLNGEVVSGNLTTNYFCYKKDVTPPTCGAGETITALSASGKYYADLSGLPAGKYYFEFVGTDGATSYKGGVKYFITLTSGVYDTTTAASAITSTSATLNGQLVGLDGTTSSKRYFLISKINPSPNHLDPSSDDTVTATSTFTGTPFSFSADLTGLTASTKYYFELIVEDNNGGTYFGGVLDFTTSANSGGGGAPAPYVPHPPTITNISAPEVCALDGQLTITGTYLAGATVKVDGVSARVLASSYSSLTVALPDGSVGTKEIKVTNVDGSATTTVKYSFADTPVYVNFLYPETYKDRAFSYTFTATDAAKYAISGILPAGLTLNPLTGEISGTPTQTGDYVFTIIASNICDSAPLIVYMYVDKAFPNAYTCSVAFNVPASNSISDIKLAQLKTCLSRIPDLSPKYIDPVIFLSGGIPAGLTSDQALTHPRYLPIIDLINSMNLDAQIYYGAFNGSTDSVQLNIYWPEPTV